MYGNARGFCAQHIFDSRIYELRASTTDTCVWAREGFTLLRLYLMWLRATAHTWCAKLLQHLRTVTRISQSSFFVWVSSNAHRIMLGCWLKASFRRPIYIYNTYKVRTHRRVQRTHTSYSFFMHSWFLFILFFFSFCIHFVVARRVQINY